MKNIGVVGIFVLVISGCATAPFVVLDNGAEKVMVGKSDPGDNYKGIGPVSGTVMGLTVVTLVTGELTKGQQQI